MKTLQELYHEVIKSDELKKEFLEAGTYKLFIFCDKQMIGQTTFTLQ